MKSFLLAVASLMYVSNGANAWCPQYGSCLNSPYVKSQCIVECHDWCYNQHSDWAGQKACKDAFCHDGALGHCHHHKCTWALDVCSGGDDSPW